MRNFIYILISISFLCLSSCMNLMDLENPQVEDVKTRNANWETVEIVLETPGILSKKLGDKAAVVEKLIISGSFDADDVTTLRALPNLQSLNMRDVTIVGGNKTYHTTINGIVSKLKDNAIGDYMFNGMKLSEIILPSNIVSIGAIAFGADNGLDSHQTFETIVIPETVKSIGDAAFRGCKKLRAIILPEQVKEFGKEIFHGCCSLEEVTLPSFMESIPGFMFHGCSSLEHIEIPQDVKRLENSAFAGCLALKSISLPSKLEYIGGAFWDSGLTSITIPDGVTKIESGKPIGITDPVGAFEGCKSLSLVNLSNTLTDMGKRAFANCTALTAIKIPESVLAISNSCFISSGLTNIELPHTLHSIKEYAFAYTPIENIILPDGLADIAFRAFLGCKKLKSIIIPKSVTSVGGGAFGYCYGLTSIFWNTSIPFPNIHYYQSQWEITNGGNLNCLLYLADENTKNDYKGWKNIIINGVADQIVLSSDEGDFYCPQSFKALNISYTKNFKYNTFPGEAAGWESLSLPFTVTRVTHEDGRVLAPFNSNVDGSKPFWLRRLTLNGFKDVTTIEANIPYIIAMPNNNKYTSDFNLKGKVTFSAKDVTVPITPSLSKEEGPDFMFCTNYKYGEGSASIYTLNKGDSELKPGSVFLRSEPYIYAFEAYVINKITSLQSPFMFSIGGKVATRNYRTVGNKPIVDDM